MMNQETLQELLAGADRRRLATLLNERKRQLQTLSCTDPTLGVWFEKFELPDLMEILKGMEEQFEKKFSHMDITKEQRRNLLNRLVEHQRRCQHCALKVDFDSKIDDVLHHKETHLLIAGHA